MIGPIRDVAFDADPATRHMQMVSREWLATAGNGSYACGTLGFVPTRRHHGLLNSNQPAPQGRTLSLVQLREEFVLSQPSTTTHQLWGNELVNAGLHVYGSEYLVKFQLDCGFPTWIYNVQGIRIEKSIVMPYQSHTVCIRYRIQGQTQRLSLKLRPMIQFRGHNDSVATSYQAKCVTTDEGHFEFTDSAAPHRLRMLIDQGTARGEAMLGNAVRYVEDSLTEQDCLYRVEQARGYEHVGNLQSEGFFELETATPSEILVVASMDDWDHVAELGRQCPFAAERTRREGLLQRIEGIDPQGVAGELVLAADQFLMTPAQRDSDRTDRDPMTATVDRRSVIAGYPWFTDWGRDTMISLAGLTLTTNRPEEAKNILLTFADYVRDGLIPNLFPEGGQDGMYHTADATLWFFQAVAQYEAATGDTELVDRLLPKLTEIVDAHITGTLFGIHVDASDGLLVQGQRGVQLTWMDAKAGDWVVTPRRGKAVEINALWYNALHLFCDWKDRDGPSDDTSRLRHLLRRARHSFNARFWFDAGGYLYDVVDGEDGNDASLRPNQLFSISLSHPVLDEHRWPQVVQSCRDHLLTPVGLRSLAKTSSDYIGRYAGDVYQRDAAYHQGAVWAWLIGPLVKAWCRAYPDQRERAMLWLQGLEAHLGEGCIGQISEIFEGDALHEPKGCFAQAWSVAEMLESYRAIKG